MLPCVPTSGTVVGDTRATTNDLYHVPTGHSIRILILLLLSSHGDRQDVGSWGVLTVCGLSASSDALVVQLLCRKAYGIDCERRECRNMK
jgi:hypothetical protein